MFVCLLAAGSCAKQPWRVVITHTQFRGSVWNTNGSATISFCKPKNIFWLSLHRLRVNANLWPMDSVLIFNLEKSKKGRCLMANLVFRHQFSIHILSMAKCKQNHNIYNALLSYTYLYSYLWCSYRGRSMPICKGNLRQNYWQQWLNEKYFALLCVGWSNVLKMNIAESSLKF